jgi:hypothetical protein
MATIVKQIPNKIPTTKQPSAMPATPPFGREPEIIDASPAVPGVE